MNFLRNLLASILGSIIAFGIAFLMFVILASLLGDVETVNIPNKAVLELKIEKPIKDYVGTNDNDPFTGLFDEEIGLDKILNAINAAAKDDRIEGIVIKNNFIQAGIAQTQAIRNALNDFKEGGKFIYSYADYYPQKDYYLASVADEIYLNPVGGMEFKGLASEVMYFKDLQEKSGVKMEVIRHGKYKSAVEPFLANKMSEANREQISALLHSIWDVMIDDMAIGDADKTNNYNKLADTLGGRTPKLAVLNGLVKSTLFYDEFENIVKEKIGLDLSEDVEYVTLEDYASVAKVSKGSSKNKIAVIYAQGDILFGEGNQKYIGQGIMKKALKKAREDDDVKAIVLRVNSGGGSALVSDIIWRAVELAKEKKPVVVSMGNVAASGGYYIAAGADKIFAQPSTITGSIGVFGTIPNATELAANIGINAEQVGTHKNSVDYSLFEPLSDAFRNQIQEGVKSTYTTFLERVAAGRGMTTEQVNLVAQGRVWSGVQAKENGLVDELGGLEDAIAAAAELAEIDDYSIKNLPYYKSGFEQFMEDFAGAKTNVFNQLVKEELGVETYDILEQLKWAQEQNGSIQAKMPFDLKIN